MDTQTLHVSQLYESAAAFAILILLLSEILVFRKQLLKHAFYFRMQEHERQQIWILQSDTQDEAAISKERQKSAIQTIRRQMTEFQNKNTESVSEGVAPPPKPELKQLSIQSLPQLNSAQKSALLFYIQFNNFMSQNVSIIMSVLVLGMLTNSTKIFSLASFFCYLFASLMFDFLHLEQRLKAQYKKGIVLRRIVKILSICFILALFISYWSLKEYN